MAFVQKKIKKIIVSSHFGMSKFGMELIDYFWSIISVVQVIGVNNQVTTSQHISFLASRLGYYGIWVVIISFNRIRIMWTWTYSDVFSFATKATGGWFHCISGVKNCQATSSLLLVLWVGNIRLATCKFTSLLVSFYFLPLFTLNPLGLMSRKTWEQSLVPYTFVRVPNFLFLTISLSFDCSISSFLFGSLLL